VAAPCSQWIACSPGRNGRRARPLNSVVRTHEHTARERSNPKTHRRIHLRRLRSVRFVGGTYRLGSIWANGASPRCNGVRGVGAILVLATSLVYSADVPAIERASRANAQVSGVADGRRLRSSRRKHCGKASGMSSNNALQRNVENRGPRLAAARSSWPPAELGR